MGQSSCLLPNFDGMTQVNSTDLAFAGASEQARMLAAGAITSTALTELYLERIARLDAEPVPPVCIAMSAQQLDRHLAARTRIPVSG
jgi:Asp-tRNA(Asn)/Glu-tRNA(Gln) amidotransferase A subunit family amidase